VDLAGILEKPGVLLRGGPEPALVVGGNFHGGDDVCIRHPARRGWDRGDPGDLGNWFWWAWAIGAMGVAVFFAPLWRRAGVVTDAELIERRYGAGAGSWLRVFKAIYSSLIVNLIVMGWVFRAMGKIAAPVLKWSEILPAGVWAGLEAGWPEAFIMGTLNETLTVVALVALVGIYSSAGGIRGVMLTDLF
jgi:Na+/proline symporter